MRRRVRHWLERKRKLWRVERFAIPPFAMRLQRMGHPSINDLFLIWDAPLWRDLS